MKKTCFIFVLCILIQVFIFAETGDQEEVDFLLFLPNSASQFVNNDRTMVHLDDIAVYLLGRNLNPGQIHVYGYAASAANDIDGEELSRERALYVISELQRRGVRAELFAEPGAFGSVDLWGSNEDEQGRSPNRRARIILDGVVLTPQEPPQEVPLLAPIPAPIVQAPEITRVNTNGSGFPWMLLPLILILLAIILFLAFKTGKKETIKENVAPTPIVKAPSVEAFPAAIVQAPSVEVPPAAIVQTPPAEVPPAAAVTYTVINLEDEIRFRAFALFLEREGHNGDEYGDWCKAVAETCARYEANGYETYAENNSWWALKKA